MNILIDIAFGVGRALGCFGLVLGAALIIHYADKKARAHEHKKYQSILLFVSALACLFPAYEMFDGVFATITGVEKAAFIVVAILCAITFFMSVSDLK